MGVLLIIQNVSKCVSLVTHQVHQTKTAFSEYILKLCYIRIAISINYLEVYDPK